MACMQTDGQAAIEGVTASGESPGYNTLDEFIYVRQVGYGSVTAGVVGVQIWFFLSNGRTRASFSCAGNMPDFKNRLHV